MNLMKSLLLTVLFSTLLHAGEQFVDKDGIANFGYDIVAYHTTFTFTKGTAEFTTTWNEVEFRFASAENRDLFLTNPEGYAPAFDGHCAFALISYKKLVVDPEAFTIVDRETGEKVDEDTYDVTNPGILYMNYSPAINKDFNKDIPKNVAGATEAWTDCLEHRPAAVPKKRLRDLISRRRPKDCPKL